MGLLLALGQMLSVRCLFACILLSILCFAKLLLVDYSCHDNQSACQSDFLFIHSVDCTLPLHFSFHTVGWVHRKWDYIRSLFFSTCDYCWRICYWSHLNSDFCSYSMSALQSLAWYCVLNSGFRPREQNKNGRVVVTRPSTFSYITEERNWENGRRLT